MINRILYHAYMHKRDHDQTEYVIVAEWHGEYGPAARVTLDRDDRWSYLDLAPRVGAWMAADRAQTFATFAQAEQRARRLMDGGTATAIRIIGREVAQ